MIGQEHGTTMSIEHHSPPGAGLIGIDIGGTKIAALLVRGDGAVLARGSVPAPAALGGAAMADAAAGLARTLAAEADVPLAAAGVGAAGVIDHETGTIRAASATFVGWAGFPLADELEARLGVPVRVENDVNAFLLGEAAAVGRTERDVLGVMLGTGVGGALLIDGELHHGPHGAAGEIGHTPGYSQLVCTCGQVGHLETLASGTSIALRYQERTGGPALDARDVADRARDGDADAIAVFHAAGRVRQRRDDPRPALCDRRGRGGRRLGPPRARDRANAAHGLAGLGYPSAHHPRRPRFRRRRARRHRDRPSCPRAGGPALRSTRTDKEHIT
jgi:glucokinase